MTGPGPSDPAGRGTRARRARPAAPPPAATAQPAPAPLRHRAACDCEARTRWRPDHAGIVYADLPIRIDRLHHRRDHPRDHRHRDRDPIRDSIASSSSTVRHRRAADLRRVNRRAVISHRARDQRRLLRLHLDDDARRRPASRSSACMVGNAAMAATLTTRTRPSSDWIALGASARHRVRASRSRSRASAPHRPGRLSAGPSPSSYTTANEPDASRALHDQYANTVVVKSARAVA